VEKDSASQECPQAKTDTRKCGRRKSPFYDHPSTRIRPVYASLAFLFGWCGVHNFYSGHILSGIAKIALFITATMLSREYKFTAIIVMEIILLWIALELFFVSKDGQGLTMQGSMGCSIVAGVVLLFPMFGFFLLPEMGKAREPAKRISCSSNVKQMGIALGMYAEDNNGFFPDKDNATGFEILRANAYLTDYKIYICPSTDKKAAESGGLSEKTVTYIYFGGLSKTPPSENAVVAFDKPDNHKKYVNVLYTNGNVTGIKLPVEIKTCEALLRFLYEDNFSTGLRQKQLEKAREFDRQPSLK